MRYLGAKDNLIEYISQILVNKQINRRKYVFFDAFCGMGSVSDAFKDLYDIIINDILNCCTVFTQARLFSSSCEFKTLGFNRRSLNLPWNEMLDYQPNILLNLNIKKGISAMP